LAILEYHANAQNSTLESTAKPNDTLRIAAASDLRFALDEIVENFKSTQKGTNVLVTFGSSGKFFAQLKQVAPFDVFLSADIAYPQTLRLEGLSGSEVMPYALGRLVIWQRKGVQNQDWKGQEAKETEITQLFTSSLLNKVAIANPAHAPYGKRAVEFLHKTKVWNNVSNRLVLSDSVSQVAQVLASGNAEVGLISLSIALTDLMKKSGNYLTVPKSMHEPLLQGMMVTKNGTAKPLAKSFTDFMQTSSAQKTLLAAGFEMPAPAKN
jgi:molybdate transport system substrate-binding protein